MSAPELFLVKDEYEEEELEEDLNIGDEVSRPSSASPSEDNFMSVRTEVANSNQRNINSVGYLTAEAKDILLEFVHRTPVLWDTRHKHYKVISIRQRLWNLARDEVVNKVGEQLSTIEVKRAWKYLTDQYKRVHNQMKSKNVPTTWFFFDKLRFLDPVLYPDEYSFPNDVVEGEVYERSLLEEPKLPKRTYAKKATSEELSVRHEEVKRARKEEVVEEQEKSDEVDDFCQHIERRLRKVKDKDYKQMRKCMRKMNDLLYELEDEIL